MCHLKVGDIVETKYGKYKVKDFAQICIMKENIPYPGYGIITESGDKITSDNVINVVGASYNILSKKI